MRCAARGNQKVNKPAEQFIRSFTTSFAVRGRAISSVFSLSERDPDGRGLGVYAGQLQINDCWHS